MKKYVWYEDLDGIIVCPNCKKQIDDLYKTDFSEDDYKLIEPEFCVYCGQHLDWAEHVNYGHIEEHGSRDLLEELIYQKEERIKELEIELELALDNLSEYRDECF